MKYFLLTLSIFMSVTSLAKNVAINNDASLPDNSTILDIKSGTKEILIPRMSNAASLPGISSTQIQEEENIPLFKDRQAESPLIDLVQLFRTLQICLAF